MSTVDLARRDFLRGGAAAGAGLVLALHLPGSERLERLERLAGNPSPFAPNAWIRIGSDDVVTLLIDKSEMGQGVLTSLPMILADELDAEWAKVRVEMAPGTDAFAALRGGRQITGGSTSVRTSWEPLRKAGAAVREMLVSAAAAEWGVEPGSCRTERSRVVHAPSSRSRSYGSLATAAAALPVPANPRLKDASAYRLIGRSVPRLDIPAKTRGRATFGIDVRVPGMLTAVVARCGVCGGKAVAFHATRAKAVPGVRHVLPISSGVAVVGDGYWPAHAGRAVLDVTWDDGAHATLDSAAIWGAFQERAARPGTVAYTRGAPAPAGARTVNAEYLVPFLAHAPMEPQNCTAHVRADACEIWAPTQHQTAVLETAAKITGLPHDRITVHTTFLGGGFGRRLEADYATEAVEISKALGVPVKVVYSREDDMQHDFFHPASLHRLSATLDANGWPVGWTHRAVGASVLARWAPEAVAGGVDEDLLSGSTKDFPYAIPSMHVECAIVDTAVPVGWWRAVGNISTAFAIESFIDELAAVGGKDPVAFRRHLLADAPRRRAVLDLVAERSGWGTPLPTGHTRGVALLDGFGSIVAQVAEVSVRGSEVQVHRVTCAIDCGRVVNPDGVRAQIMSGIAFGLTAALKGEITIERGRVQQSNFADYPVMRMNEMPVVDVHLVPSTEPPGGVGEPGVPPVMPAVANAVFAATRRRVRKVPLRLA